MRRVVEENERELVLRANFAFRNNDKRNTDGPTCTQFKMNWLKNWSSNFDLYRTVFAALKNTAMQKKISVSREVVGGRGGGQLLVALLRYATARNDNVRTVLM